MDNTNIVTYNFDTTGVVEEVAAENNVPVEEIEDKAVEIGGKILTATEKRRASAKRYYEKNRDKIKQKYRESYQAKPKAEGQKRGRKPNPKPEPVIPKPRGRKPMQVEAVTDEAARAALTIEAAALKEQIVLARKELWAKQKQLSQIEARLKVKEVAPEVANDNPADNIE